jgi:hypothetical protein
MNSELRYSRIVATVNRVREHSSGSHRFLDKSVLLRGDPAALAIANGKTIFKTSVRVLIRCCPGLVVAVDDPVLESEARGILHDAEGGGSVVATSEANPASFDAILSIGPVVDQGLPDTAVWSDGWCAQVSSFGSMDWGSASENAIGAVAAACLGTGEVFKRLLELKRDSGRLLDRISFSLYDYRETIDPGPPLGAIELPPFLLVGAGAIGNGIALTLIESRASGSATVIDYQPYGPENWATCVLMVAAEEGHSKAAAIAGRLRATGRFTARPLQQMVEQFSGHVPPVVISALDSPEARRVLQLMWPDVVIDGAIADFPCEVGVHQWGPDTACLRCWYQLPVGPSAAVVQADATGLPYHLLADPDAPVTEAHVDAAGAEQREFWRDRMGQPVCSVVAEAVAAAISAGKLGRGFQPSVPFVACFSAAMVVGELFKHAMSLSTSLEPRFQFDFRWGPGRGLALPMSRLPSCDCVNRRDQIEAVRAKRKVELKRGDRAGESP